MNLGPERDIPQYFLSLLKGRLKLSLQRSNEEESGGFKQFPRSWGALPLAPRDGCLNTATFLGACPHGEFIWIGFYNTDGTICSEIEVDGPDATFRAWVRTPPTFCLTHFSAGQYSYPVTDVLCPKASRESVCISIVASDLNDRTNFSKAVIHMIYPEDLSDMSIAMPEPIDPTSRRPVNLLP